ncbi:MAG: hypothetical protein ABS79_05890 [Planctomycetes bacterium SCN 63-9]|nr:MAG: hypothetical protein ABS79_05890 [Planctomycetes bacterium SCN 63-9]
MPNQLVELVRRWIEWGKVDAQSMPEIESIEAGFSGFGDPTRPGIDPRVIRSWEGRHGFNLPDGLRDWLALSNGLYRGSPIIHPISAIGPMVPFARVPGMIVQPESWFELGNPNVETVCIDLGYRWPGQGHTIFTSGDDASGSPPRIIAKSFEEWFLELLAQGGREYWFAPGFVSLGDPWEAHRRHVPPPDLPERLMKLADRVRPLMKREVDERAIANELGISRTELELLFRYLQHRAPGLSAS